MASEITSTRTKTALQSRLDRLLERRAVVEWNHPIFEGLLAGSQRSRASRIAHFKLTWGAMNDRWKHTLEGRNFKFSYIVWALNNEKQIHWFKKVLERSNKAKLELKGEIERITARLQKQECVESSAI